MFFYVWKCLASQRTTTAALLWWRRYQRWAYEAFSDEQDRRSWYDWWHGQRGEGHGSLILYAGAGGWTNLWTLISVLECRRASKYLGGRRWHARAVAPLKVWGWGQAAFLILHFWCRTLPTVWIWYSYSFFKKKFITNDDFFLEQRFTQTPNRRPSATKKHYISDRDRQADWCVAAKNHHQMVDDADLGYDPHQMSGSERGSTVTSSENKMQKAKESYLEGRPSASGLRHILCPPID